MKQKQTVELCLEKSFWCDYWHMELVGSKYIRSLLSVRELCCQINHESAFKKLLTFWDLQLLGPQCSMRKKVAEKKKTVQLPRSPCFPLPTSEVLKRIMEKKEHLRGKSLQPWSTTGVQLLSRLSTKASSRNTHHTREKGGFIITACPQSSPFQVKMCAVTILPLPPMYIQQRWEGHYFPFSSQVIWSQRPSHRPHEETHVLHRTWCSDWIGLWVVSPKTGLRCHICVKKE